MKFGISLKFLQGSQAELGLSLGDVEVEFSSIQGSATSWHAAGRTGVHLPWRRKCAVVVYPREMFPFLPPWSFLQRGSKFLIPCFALQPLKERQAHQHCGITDSRHCEIRPLIKGLCDCNIRGWVAFITYPQSTNKVWTRKVVKMDLLSHHRNKSYPKSESLSLLITATAKMSLSVFYLGCTCLIINLPSTNLPFIWGSSKHFTRA